jgi:hypothetical protein
MSERRSQAGTSLASETLGVDKFVRMKVSSAS